MKDGVKSVATTATTIGEKGALLEAAEGALQPSSSVTSGTASEKDKDKEKDSKESDREKGSSKKAAVSSAATTTRDVQSVATSRKSKKRSGLFPEKTGKSRSSRRSEVEKFHKI